MRRLFLYLPVFVLLPFAVSRAANAPTTAPVSSSAETAYEMLLVAFYDSNESGEKDLVRLTESMKSWPVKPRLAPGYPKVVATSSIKDLPPGEYAIVFSVCQVDAKGVSADLKNYVKTMETASAAYPVTWTDASIPCPSVDGKLVSAVMNHTRGQRILFVATAKNGNWNGVARWADSRGSVLSEIDLKGCGTPEVLESGSTLVIGYSCKTPVEGCAAKGRSEYTMTITANRDTLSATVSEEQTVPAQCR